MFRDRQDVWTDALLWGVTAALILVAVATAALFVLNGWRLLAG
jgi:hypothetical protein